MNTKANLGQHGDLHFSLWRVFGILLAVFINSAWPTDVQFDKGSSNRCIQALEKIDPSHCVVIEKMYRLSKIKNRGQHKLFTLFENDSATIKADSLSIVLDLKDELECEGDSNSSYSISVQRIAKHIADGQPVKPLAAMDSVVLLNLIISLSAQDLVIVREGYPEVYSISNYALPSCIDPYVEVSTLSIPGLKLPHSRKFAVRPGFE